MVLNAPPKSSPPIAPRPLTCGKTTNLQKIYDSRPATVGAMLSLATQTDRTLFFDFLPIELGTIRGMKTRIQLHGAWPGLLRCDPEIGLAGRSRRGVRGGFPSPRC